jgi:hypothetical protein
VASSYRSPETRALLAEYGSIGGHIGWANTVDRRARLANAHANSPTDVAWHARKLGLDLDTRFPVEWLLDRRIQQLSDADHRAFVNAFMWSVANRTDGRVACADLALIPGMSDSAAALVAAGLWAVVDETGWLITDFESTQTSRAEHEMLERARRKEREKKARQRAKVAQQEPGQNPVQGDSPEGRPRGHVPGTTQEGRQAGRLL